MDEIIYASATSIAQAIRDKRVSAAKWSRRTCSASRR